MTDFVHAIEALAVITIFVVLYQVRKHYIISLIAHKDKQKQRQNPSIKFTPRQVEFDYSSSSLLPSLEVQEEQQEEDKKIDAAKATTHPRALEPLKTKSHKVKAEKPVNIEEAGHKSALGNYIDDFFSADAYEKQQPINTDTLQQMKHASAVNDESSVALFTGQTI